MFSEAGKQGFSAHLCRDVNCLFTSSESGFMAYIMVVGLKLFHRAFTQTTNCDQSCNMYEVTLINGKFQENLL